jgi:hypothetical protein
VGHDDVGGAKTKRWRRGDLAGGQGLWAVTKLGGSGAVAVQQIQSLNASVPEFAKRSP